MGFVDIEATADGYESRCLARVYHQGAGDRAQLTQETFGEYRVRWVRRAAGWRAAEWRFDVSFTTGSWDVFQPG